MAIVEIKDLVKKFPVGKDFFTALNHGKLPIWKNKKQGMRNWWLINAFFYSLVI